jgi:hypothetical protein
MALRRDALLEPQARRRVTRVSTAQSSIVPSGHPNFEALSEECLLLNHLQTGIFQG